MMMTHLGKHRVKVCRVNQEYADLYQSRNQDSRDLNEPLTNIVRMGWVCSVRLIVRVCILILSSCNMFQIECQVKKT